VTGEIKVALQGHTNVVHDVAVTPDGRHGVGHLAKSIHGYYLVYRNFDNETKTNRWFAKYETGSDRFGEQVSRVEFQGFDGLEDAQAFCEKNALDVERALHGGTRPSEAP
jgi:hypothetical protein